MLLMGCSPDSTGPEEAVCEEQCLPADFSLQNADGDALSLPELTGEAEALIVYGTATWCFSCREEFAWLNEVQAASSGRVAAVAVVLESTEPGKAPTEEDIALLEGAYEPTFPVLLDEDGFMNEYRTSNAIPVNLVTNAEQRWTIALRREGLNAEALQEAIDSITSQGEEP